MGEVVGGEILMKLTLCNTLHVLSPRHILDTRLELENLEVSSELIHSSEIAQRIRQEFKGRNGIGLPAPADTLSERTQSTDPVQVTDSYSGHTGDNTVKICRS